MLVDGDIFIEFLVSSLAVFCGGNTLGIDVAKPFATGIEGIVH